MAEAIRRLLPFARVHAWHVTQHTPDVDAFIDRMRDSPLFITQLLPSHGFEGLVPERLRALGVANMQLVPPILFDGFHPDACLVTHQDRQLESPIDSYHSLIAISAYLAGFDADRSVALYNKFIYAQLGYLSAYEKAKAVFLDYLGKHGFRDLAERRWATWMEEGAFMHTPLHPRVRVLASFATEVVHRAGLSDHNMAEPTQICDVFDEQHAWPVYPALAEAIGIDGSETFRTHHWAVAMEAERTIDLAHFVQSSFEIYRRTPSEVLTTPQARQAVEVLRSVVR